MERLFWGLIKSRYFEDDSTLIVWWLDQNVDYDYVYEKVCDMDFQSLIDSETVAVYASGVMVTGDPLRQIPEPHESQMVDCIPFMDDQDSYLFHIEPYLN